MRAEEFESKIDNHLKFLMDCGRRKFKHGFFAAIMRGFVHLRDLSGLSKYYEFMISLGQIPTTETYNVMLNCCALLGDSESALALVEDMVQYKTPRDVFTYTTAMNSCVKAEDYNTIESLFNRMIQEGITPTVQTYTTLLSNGGLEQQMTETVLKTMEKLEVKPDLKFLSVLLADSSRKRDLPKILTYYSLFGKYNIEPDYNVFKIIIDACGKVGQAELADKFWNKLKNTDIPITEEIFTSIICCWAEVNEDDKVKNYFKEMIESGFKPSTRAFNALLRTAQTIRELRQLYNHMLQIKLVPNNYTFLIMKVKCISLKDFDFLRNYVYEEAGKFGFDLNKNIV